MLALLKLDRFMASIEDRSFRENLEGSSCGLAVSRLDVGLASMPSAKRLLEELLENVSREKSVVG